MPSREREPRDLPAQPGSSPTAPGNPWTPDEQAAASAAYQQLWDSAAAWAAYQQARTAGKSHDEALEAGRQAGEAGRPAATPPAAPATPAAPAASAASSGLGGGLAGTSFTQPFPGVFHPPAAPTGPPSWWTPPPTFTPPAYKQAPPFQAPTLEQALSDPGYAFAAKEGQNALERSAAARGTLGTGGTLKDILAWGGNYAQQRYGDVWNRAADTYDRNLKSQYADPYAAAFQGATAAYAPQLFGWGQQIAATQRQGENDWTRAWDAFNFDYNKYRNQQLDLWGRVKDASSI